VRPDRAPHPTSRSEPPVAGSSAPEATSGTVQLMSCSSTLLRMPRSPHAVLTARLALITGLADDLARANGGETPATRALADAIKREVDGVSRALRRPQRYFAVLGHDSAGGTTS
jgi:hypothetical protein